MDDHNKPAANLREWLGLRGQFDYSKARLLGVVLGILLAMLGIVLTLAFVVTLYDFLRAGLRVGPFAADATGEAIRNIGLVLAALIGAPLVVWRSYVAAQQAATQAESLFNDKINAAAQDLAARRQVTRVIGRGKEHRVLTEWQDDLVTRAAAIDRLEGLANERPDAAPRIARQLSIYVRELSRDHPAQEPPKGATPVELRGWARTLQPARPDMEKAAQSLGRLQRIKGANLAPSDIDLRNANLQGFDLSGLSYEKALFQGARMQGADFRDAQMQGAVLNGAQMQGAYLSEAQMQWVVLNGAQMQGAVLFDAQMQGAYLFGVEMDETTNLRDASLHGAAVWHVDEATIERLRRFWSDIFADGSVPVPKDDPDRPDWPSEKLDGDAFVTQWLAWQAELPPE